MERVNQAVKPLNDEQLAALDASYRRIPDFEDWPKLVPRHEVWDGKRVELHDLKEAAAAEHLSAALEVTMRTAAFDTGAIEDLYRTDRGLTYTVATQAAMWEQAVEEQNPDVRPLFEAQLRAYELVLDAATKQMPVTEAWIRRLHEELTSPQETYVVHTPIGSQRHPLPRGEYKHHPNHVQTADGGAHAYAPVHQTRPEMGRLLANIDGRSFRDADPVLQASYAHYAFVAIHPFADGNGRVSRALASTYFYRALGVPFLVLADQRDDYFSALAKADEGDFGVFVAFAGEAGLSAMDMVVDSLRAAVAPHPEEALKGFKRLLTAQGGLTHSELDGVARGLIDELGAAFKERMAGLEFPVGVTFNVVSGTGSHHNASIEGFRPVIAGGGRYLTLSLGSKAPAHAKLEVPFEVLVSTSRDEAATFRIQQYGGDDGLTFRLRDVSPELTAAAQYRVQAFAERVIGTHLEILLESAKESLRRAGYAGHDEDRT
jgi:fido (protein-threonine AMPylation protein)